MTKKLLTNNNAMIVSDGTPEGTRIKIGDIFLNNVAKIELDPIEPNKLITAKVTLHCVALEFNSTYAEFQCVDTGCETFLQKG